MTLFFDLAADMYEQYEPISGLIFELFAEASRDASLRKIIRGSFDKDRETMRAFLVELQRRNKIGSDFNVNSVAMAIVALFYGYAISRLLGVGKDEAKRTYREAMRLMLARSEAFHNNIQK